MLPSPGENMKYKYRCKNAEDSMRVQEALFDMGYGWRIHPKKVIGHARFLFIDEDTKQITHDVADWFHNCGLPELIL